MSSVVWANADLRHLILEAAFSEKCKGLPRDVLELLDVPRGKYRTNDWSAWQMYAAMCGVNKQWRVCALRLIEAARRRRLAHFMNGRAAGLNGGRTIFNVIYRPKHLSSATHLPVTYLNELMVANQQPSYGRDVASTANSTIPPEGILLIQYVNLFDAVHGANTQCYKSEMIRHAHWEVLVPPKARIGSEFIRVANELDVAPVRQVGKSSVRVERNGEITSMVRYCINSAAGWQTVHGELLPPDEASKVDSYLGNELAVATAIAPDRCSEFLSTFL